MLTGPRGLFLIAGQEKVVTVDLERVLTAPPVEHLTVHNSPLFTNPRGGRLTRAGIADIVSRHAAGAREAGTPIPDGISPHSFRHQKAVDLLEAGVPLVYIRDVLGHASVATTEIYAKVSLERKRELLEKAASSPAPAAEGYPDWTADSDRMSWLAGLC